MEKERSSSKDTTSNLFNRYVWLVDTIYRAGLITFEEINERWIRSSLNSLGDEFPIKTFHNHRNAIEQMFDINIECNKRGGYTYYIENSDDMERGGVRTWLLNTFAVNNLINESHKLKHRILFEHIPSGQQYLTPIIEAMRESVSVEISYQGYWHDEPFTVEVEPYCVKIFRQRWYMVAFNPLKKMVMTYSLDRVSSIRLMDRKFIFPSSFNPEEYFHNSFGITNYGKAEEVKIKVWHNDKKHRYFTSLPLHHSQQLVEQADDYSIFSYYIQPTYDFRQEILSHGAEVEVLAPAWFREEIKAIVNELKKNYSKKTNQQ